MQPSCDCEQPVFIIELETIKIDEKKRSKQNIENQVKNPLSVKKQEETLVKMIIWWPRSAKLPKGQMLDFGLRTLLIVQEFIAKKFKKYLHISTIQKLLIKLWLTNQKPLVRAYQQNPAAVQEWLQVRYPAIKKQAKKENREIVRWDESWFKSTVIEEKHDEKKEKRQ